MRTVLVTGGNRGIGLEICRQLDELGYFVILGSRDIEKGEKASAALSKNVIVTQLDVTNEDSIIGLFEFVNTTYGKLDVLVNNAGIGEQQNSNQNGILAKTKKILETNVYGARQINKVLIPFLRKTGVISRSTGAANASPENIRRVMETNFYGALRMIQAFLPLLLNSENGRIINVSSGMGELKSLTGYMPAYSLSKASLNALTIMLSNELKDTGIKVNAVCPGWVKTDMGGHNAPLTVGQGADTIVWLATEKEISTGKFYKNRNEIEW
jgi:NAD(P)-dependent dehydrogenase (short-subunit alcohol dehydrogenase family)